MQKFNVGVLLVAVGTAMGATYESRGEVVVLSGPWTARTLVTPENFCCDGCTDTAASGNFSLACPQWDTASRGQPIAMSVRFNVRGSGTFSGNPLPNAIGGYATHGTISGAATGPGVGTLRASTTFPDCGGPIFRVQSVSCGWGEQAASSNLITIPQGSRSSYFGSGTVNFVASTGWSSVLALSGTCLQPYRYTVPTEVQMELVVEYCPADFNGDRFVDFFDYDSFVSCFEGGACPAGRNADTNGDGFIDFNDYDAFVTAFEAGC
jgi:hypothetical protein